MVALFQPAVHLPIDGFAVSVMEHGNGPVAKQDGFEILPHLRHEEELEHVLVGGCQCGIDYRAAVEHQSDVDVHKQGE